MVARTGTSWNTASEIAPAGRSEAYSTGTRPDAPAGVNRWNRPGRVGVPAQKPRGLYSASYTRRISLPAPNWNPANKAALVITDYFIISITGDSRRR